jgi:hypothetical protein
MIENRQRVCKLTFERMLEDPEQLYGQGIGSNYQRQTETLGKHFRRPSAASPTRPAHHHGDAPDDGDSDQAQPELLHPDA